MAETIEQAIVEMKTLFERQNRLVLQAAPGTGKTTRVPLALLDESWLRGKKIIMLEPRRVAARLAAQYMATQLGESVGETVGYRIRHDQKISARTRLEVVTDGLFTRMIQDDPSLEGVGLVIFDEFHERGWQSDIGFAFSLQAQQLFRSDLRLLIMSATLNGESLAKWLGDAPFVQATGKPYPLRVEHVPRTSATQSPVEHVVYAVERALREFEGDVLVFLPGVREIRAAQQTLNESDFLSNRDDKLRILPLHSRLTIAQQLAALAAPTLGVRKVVLSTTLAESSVTVEGVRVVIDAGWTRISRYSARTGMNRLETIRVSKASATQRAGRAARIAPGVCLRLWHADEERTMMDAQKPELLDMDLLAPTLELLYWGVSTPQQLQWLDEWPAHKWAQALQNLQMLGAVDEQERLNEHGKLLLQAGVDVRFASLLLHARTIGWTELACELVAWLSEGERQLHTVSTDIEQFLQMQRTNAVEQECTRLLRWMERFPPSEKGESSFDRTDQMGILLAWAYPDRIAFRRLDNNNFADRQTYRMSNGRGCFDPFAVSDSRRSFLVIADADDVGADARIRLTGEMSERAFLYACGHLMKKEYAVFWDEEKSAMRAVEREMFMKLEWKSRTVSVLDEPLLVEAWKTVLQNKGVGLLPWERQASQYLQRLRTLRVFQLQKHVDEPLPSLEDEDLLARLDDWLAADLARCKTLTDLRKINLVQALQRMVNYKTMAQLEQSMPTHWRVPSGSRIAIDYNNPQVPVLAVRLQELFGLQTTPAIADGRLPLTLHLLSPAGRPVQVTRDLANFWRHTYPEVRKELRGRYPKHVWPDDPLAEAPTARAKPRQK